jgi:hypothetical protein
MTELELKAKSRLTGSARKPTFFQTVTFDIGKFVFPSMTIPSMLAGSCGDWDCGSGGGGGGGGGGINGSCKATAVTMTHNAKLLMPISPRML